MERASFIGILLGIFAIVGGNIMEGGNIYSILQPTAAFIVFGGTIGATLLSFPVGDVLKAVRSVKDIFRKDDTEPEAFIKDVTRFSTIARRNGLIALEIEIPRISNEFLKKSLRLAVDGMTSKLLKETMEQENITYEYEKKRIAKVFDTAGGFAPTIGIIGAVLGLIHVMENLSDPSRLGSGIAVAFVATIYGVGSANLVLLPLSKKLINRMNMELSYREMVLEGVLGILSGINPHYLEERLRVHIENDRKG
jgi:chemotaxis protein MotA